MAVFLLPLVALAESKPEYGWVEKVRVTPGDILVDAKLDTGADSCSIDASGMEEFERDGRNWVRFDIRNRYGKTATIEKEVRRLAIVKRHHGKHQRRPVIRLGVCLDKIYLETDVTLVDRTSFDYQMLLGRNFLAGNAVVNPAITFTAEPKCKEQAAMRERSDSAQGSKADGAKKAASSPTQGGSAE